jgi:hypothetical protein
MLGMILHPRVPVVVPLLVEAVVQVAMGRGEQEAHSLVGRVVGPGAGVDRLWN